jgi:hypothetical protein
MAMFFLLKKPRKLPFNQIRPEIYQDTELRKIVAVHNSDSLKAKQLVHGDDLKS